MLEFADGDVSCELDVVEHSCSDSRPWAWKTKGDDLVRMRDSPWVISENDM